jgi:hypothetical protein
LMARCTCRKQTPGQGGATKSEDVPPWTLEAKAGWCRGNTAMYCACCKPVADQHMQVAALACMATTWSLLGCHTAQMHAEHAGAHAAWCVKCRLGSFILKPTMQPQASEGHWAACNSRKCMQCSCCCYCWPGHEDHCWRGL